MSEAKIFATEVPKKVIRKFPKREVITSGLDDIWAIDLLDVSKTKKLMEILHFYCVLLIYTVNMRGLYLLKTRLKKLFWMPLKVLDIFQ